MSLRWVQVVAPTNSVRIRAAQVVETVAGEAPGARRRFRALLERERPGHGLATPARRAVRGSTSARERVLVHDGLDAARGRRSCRGTWRRRAAGPRPASCRGDHVDAAAPPHPVRWDRVGQLVPGHGSSGRANDGASGPSAIGTWPTASTLVTIAPPSCQPAHTPVRASRCSGGAVVVDDGLRRRATPTAGSASRRLSSGE